MMRRALLLLLLPALAAAGRAQESRQDVSVSGTGVFPVQVSSDKGAVETGDKAAGVLASYRYMLTPRSGLELNYQWAQTTYHIVDNNLGPTYGGPVHTRIQELSGAYVFNLNYGKFNPFLEAGVGGYIFTPLTDNVFAIDSSRGTNVGALFGAGVAYEISPSFDIRAEYRGSFIKAPSFGIPSVSLGKYTVLSTPAIGIAYHF